MLSFTKTCRFGDAVHRWFRRYPCLLTAIIRAKSAANTVEATFATERHRNEGVVAKIRARRERMPRLWHFSNRPCCACSRACYVQERRCETPVRPAAGQPRCVPIWRASCQTNMSFLKAEEPNSARSHAARPTQTENTRSIQALDGAADWRQRCTQNW